MQKQLAHGEEIVVEGSSFVACSESVTCDAVRSGSCWGMLCGGEGLFNTALKGKSVTAAAAVVVTVVVLTYYVL